MKENNIIELEEWREIPGYEGYYEVSSLGRVRSIDRWVTYSNGRKQFYEGKLLKQDADKKGRFTVGLNKKGKPSTKRVHILVALAFIGPRPDGMVICHCNGNNKDNRLINIRYDTQSENTIDKYRHGNKHGQGKLTIDEVMEMRRLYDTGDYTQMELSEMFNIGATSTGMIVTRKHFTWLNDDGTINNSNTAIQ